MTSDTTQDYQDLKEAILDTYFDACRDHAFRKGWPHLQIMAFVDDCFVGHIEGPLHHLMFKTAFLILSGGWYPEQDAIIKKSIAELLLSEEVKAALAIMHHDEPLKRDLILLGLMTR